MNFQLNVSKRINNSPEKSDLKREIQTYKSKVKIFEKELNSKKIQIDKCKF